MDRNGFGVYTGVDERLHDDVGPVSVHGGQHERRSPETVHCVRVRRPRQQQSNAVVAAPVCRLQRRHFHNTPATDTSQTSSQSPK